MRLRLGIYFIILTFISTLLLLKRLNLFNFDTAYSSGYSEDAFNLIRPGMTQQEVLQRLGEPLTHSEVNSLWNEGEQAFVSELWNYSRQANNANYFQRRILFDRDHRVLRTEKEIYWD